MAEPAGRLEYSNEDVRERQTGRENEAKNTWALSDSEKSELYGFAYERGQ